MAVAKDLTKGLLASPSCMPRLSQAQADGLKALGIEAISAIPPDFPLTARQTIIRDATTTGRPFVAPDLARLLRGYGPPACYVDFEAIMPPIPLYEGTRPYQKQREIIDTIIRGVHPDLAGNGPIDVAILSKSEGFVWVKQAVRRSVKM